MFNYICFAHEIDKDRNVYDNQRHLAFGSRKLRLVTSITEYARRYTYTRDVIDKERNIVREG